VTVYELSTPLSEEAVRKLEVNDAVYLSGLLVTMRDAAHRRALLFHKEGKRLPVELRGMAVFHCGPLVKEADGGWKVVAAGPTTSTRMEPFEAELIENLGVRMVIGKGGMGRRTAEAMKRGGAVYCAFTGGAAVLAAKAIKYVKGAEWIDLGMPEAMWLFEVDNFGPLTVAIDAHGNNLYEAVKGNVEKELPRIYKKLGL